MKKKWRAAYLRVSSDEQREQQTIETQRDAIEKYCQSKGIKIDRWYVDDGVSGKIPMGKRPGGSELMADAEAGKISDLHVLKLDRVGRVLALILQVYERLTALGVNVDFITQPLPAGAAGTAFMQMLGVFAEFDRTNILENTSRGQRRKAATGWTGGPCAFGYRVEGIKREARLVIHDIYGPIVVIMFEFAAAGQSCQYIADWLNNQGVPTSRQNPGSVWRECSVRRILRNPIYRGVRQWGKLHVERTEDSAGDLIRHLRKSPAEQIIDCPVPRLVDDDLFERAQATITADATVASSHAKTFYLLRGLLKCGICGCRLVGRGGRYYACIARHSYKRLYGPKAKACKLPILYRDVTENSMWEICAPYIVEHHKAKDELRRVMEREAAPEANAAERLRTEHAKLERLEASYERAKMLYVNGDYSDARYEEVKKKLAGKRPDIEKSIANFELILSNEGTQKKALQQVDSAWELFCRDVDKRFPPEEKRRIINAMVESITVQANGECHPKLRFAKDVKDFLRERIQRRFPAANLQFTPPTPEQNAAGEKALRVAVDATFARNS